MKCNQCIEFFDDYFNKKLNTNIENDFTNHINSCEKCMAEYKLYESYISLDMVENDFLVPHDLDAKIKFKLSQVRTKKTPFVLLSKKVLTYATSISFLFLIGIFGSTYYDSIKQEYDASLNMQPISTPAPTPITGTGEVTNVVTPEPKQELEEIIAPKENPTPKKEISPKNTPTPKKEETKELPKENTPVPSPSNIEVPPTKSDEVATDVTMPTVVDEPNNKNDVVAIEPTTPHLFMASMLIAPDESIASADVTPPPMLKASRKIEEPLFDIALPLEHKDVILEKYDEIDLGNEIYEINAPKEEFITEFSEIEFNFDTVDETKTSLKIKFE